jgi:hypothetical protein
MEAEHGMDSSSSFDFDTKAIRSIRLEGYDDVYYKVIEEPTVLKKLGDWWDNIGHGGKAYMFISVLI